MKHVKFKDFPKEIKDLWYKRHMPYQALYSLDCPDLEAIVEGTALVQSLEMGLEIAQAAFPVLFPAE